MRETTRIIFNGKQAMSSTDSTLMTPPKNKQQGTRNRRKEERRETRCGQVTAYVPCHSHPKPSNKQRERVPHTWQLQNKQKRTNKNKKAWESIAGSQTKHIAGRSGQATPRWRLLRKDIEKTVANCSEDWDFPAPQFPSGPPGLQS